MKKPDMRDIRGGLTNTLMIQMMENQVCIMTALSIIVRNKGAEARLLRGAEATINTLKSVNEFADVTVAVIERDGGTTQ